MPSKTSEPLSKTLTIGRLAKAAGVGVETVRYYQLRGLLPVPHSQGAYRHYPVALGDRIRFVKRAQELGFSLDEVAQLLALEDGTERDAIRRIANQRLLQIQAKLTDLARMKKTLKQLLKECQHTGQEQPCPIIGTLATAQQ